MKIQNETITKKRGETINKLIEPNTKNLNKSGIKSMMLYNWQKNV